MIELLELLKLASDAKTQQEVSTQLEAHALLIRTMHKDLSMVIGGQIGIGVCLIVLGGLAIYLGIIVSRMDKRIKALEAK